MFSKAERMIAFRYLRSRRREGFISIIAGFSFLGIALGVATLIVVMAVMNGFRAEITNKILGLNGHVSVSSYEGRINKFDDFSETIEGVEGVTSVTPVIDAQVMVTTEYANTGAVVKGMRLDDIMKRPLLYNNIVFGSLTDFKGNGSIAIGFHMSNRLGITIGDKVTLLSPKGHSTAFGTMPRLKTYKVSAVFETGMYEYDNNIILMPLDAAQLFFKYPDSVSGIEILTDNPHDSKNVVEKVNLLIKRVLLVQDWQSLNASLFTALKVERTVMFLILTLIVFIAAFNIISSLIMLVNDKGKDIAILRTMGATRGMIMRIFLLCGSSIGIVGTFIGFILGISFASNIEAIRAWLEGVIGNRLFDPVIYFLSELPADVQNQDVIWSVSMGITFSLLATIYPAWKAAKQDPAEALRYE